MLETLLFLVWLAEVVVEEVPPPYSSSLCSSDR